jgi:hypothetical protein
MKYFEEILSYKNNEISCLKVHSQTLHMEVKKLKHNGYINPKSRQKDNHIGTQITKSVAHKNQRSNVNVVLTFQSIQKLTHLEVDSKEDQINTLINKEFHKEFV